MLLGSVSLYAPNARPARPKEGVDFDLEHGELEVLATDEKNPKLCGPGLYMFFSGGKRLSGPALKNGSALIEGLGQP